MALRTGELVELYQTKQVVNTDSQKEKTIDHYITAFIAASGLFVIVVIVTIYKIKKYNDNVKLVKEEIELEEK